MQTPESFNFPFPPYDIQKDFMKNLYEAIENGKLGIFESPTGTGKSLSIICGALRWIVDHENFVIENYEKQIEQLKSKKQEIVDKSNDDWLTSQAEEMNIKKEIDSIIIKLNEEKLYQQKIEQLKIALKNSDNESTRKIFEIKENDSTNLNEAETVDDDDILLENVTVLDNQDSDKLIDNSEELEEKECLKIYFCSRTHSQLSQFVNEVKKTDYDQMIRVVPLASRQCYCINDTVNKLKNLSLINDRCLDLQKAKSEKTTLKSKDGHKLKRKKTSSGCSFMKQGNIETLKNQILFEVQDIEDLVKKGKKLKACPYYGTRSALQDAQLVVLPYNTLLHESTRTSSGIKLKDNIVIIDEAHNLLDTIGHIHSSEINGEQLTHCHSQLLQYRDKYSKRFNAFNLLYLNQIIYIIDRLIKLLEKQNSNEKDITSREAPSTSIHTLQDFLLTAEIDNLNLYKLLNFFNQSKIAHKLHSFTEKYHPTVKIIKSEPESSGISKFLKSMSTTSQSSKPNEENNPEKEEYISSNPILPLINFIKSLTNFCEDGRIICKKGKNLNSGCFKYLLLNPAAHFIDLVKTCRSVIVAGGTMQPISEFYDQLFIAAGGTPDRIIQFSCGHIIPKENILPIVLNSGPTGKVFDFSYETRNDKALLDELGRVLQNIVNIIPGGIVCFFSSYQYEQQIYEYFDKCGVLNKIKLKKEIFREPKLTSQVEAVLEKYAKAIKNSSLKLDSKTGALLFSVVGGKLSEGLNFNDDLGRCVIVVGMPYPNIKSIELQEKMKFLNSNIKSTTGSIYYENLCMKAVNQCIGRAIRHKQDYASILLLDKRYSQIRVQNLLPSWIQKSLVIQNNFGPVMGLLAKFFVNQKKKTNAVL